MADDEAPWAVMSRVWRERVDLPRVDANALRIAAAAETARMRRWLVVEVAMSVAAAAAAAFYAVLVPGSRSLLILLDTLAVIAIVWAFVLWGRRGLWGPAAETSQAYVALARRRARLRLLTTWLAFALVAAQIAVRVVFDGGVSSLQLIVAAVWVGWALWMRRRAIRELEFYDGLVREAETGLRL
jgi:hypothetical protein